MEPLSFALAIIGLGLVLFGLGAILAWYWAVKSLRIRPPGWITGVVAAAGVSLVGSQVLAGDWLYGATTYVLFAMIVGGQLQVGPFRPSGR